MEGEQGEGKQWSDKAGQSIAHRSFALITDATLPERPVTPVDILGVPIQGSGSECLSGTYSAYVCVGTVVKLGDHSHHIFLTMYIP